MQTYLTVPQSNFTIPYSDENTYLALIDHVMENGTPSEDRTGTGTHSVFGAQLRFDLSKGKLPALTTKKINLSAPKLEMDWMMSGNTNIKWLQDRGIRIWDGWTRKGAITEASPVHLVENKCDQSDLATLVATRIFTHVGTGHSVGINGDFPEDVNETTQEQYKQYMEHTMYSINKYVNGVPDDENEYKPIALLKVIGCLGLSKELQDFKTFCKVFQQYKPNNPFNYNDILYATSTYQGEKIITPENVKFATDKVIYMWHIADTEGYWKEDIEHFLPSGKSWVYHFDNPDSSSAKLIKPEAGDKLLRHMETNGDVGPIYGESWRSFKANGEPWIARYESLDQLKGLIEDIKNNKRSRRHLLLAWNPMRLKDMALPPCHVLVQFYAIPATAEEIAAHKNYASGVFNEKPTHKLSLQVYFRSNDLGLGTPYNILNYSYMLINIATRCGMTPGDVLISIGDAHVYMNHFDGLQTQLDRVVLGFPNYRILRHTPHGNHDVGYTEIDVTGYNPHPYIHLPVAV